MKEVWICDPNYHKIRSSFALIFSKNYQCFEKLYQTLERVFHQISKHLEVRQKKNSAAPRFFNPLLSVWISDETLFLVFDTLSHHPPLLEFVILFSLLYFDKIIVLLFCLLGVPPELSNICYELAVAYNVSYLKLRGQSNYLSVGGHHKSASILHKTLFRGIQWSSKSLSAPQ